MRKSVSLKLPSRVPSSRKPKRGYRSTFQRLIRLPPTLLQLHTDQWGLLSAREIVGVSPHWCPPPWWPLSRGEWLFLPCSHRQLPVLWPRGRWLELRTWVNSPSSLVSWISWSLPLHQVCPFASMYTCNYNNIMYVYYNNIIMVMLLSILLSQLNAGCSVSRTYTCTNCTHMHVHSVHVHPLYPRITQWLHVDTFLCVYSVGLITSFSVSDNIRYPWQFVQQHWCCWHQSTEQSS